MNRKQKKSLYSILISFVLLIAVFVLDKTHLLPDAVCKILYLIPYGIVGHDVLRKAVLGIKNKEVFDENFLMAVATIGALCLGEFTEAVAVMLFYQIGELFQSIAVGRSRKNISDLMDIRPDYANLLNENGECEEVDPEEVETGSLILCRPGEKVPIDGIVKEGTSSLDTSSLTGESLPRKVRPGDSVISGCINLDGLLKIETTKEFGESTVSKILELVENSSMKKAKAEHFITKFAHYYTPVVCYSALVLGLAVPTLTGIISGSFAYSVWIKRALTFLVISCPCALVVSIPLSFFGGIGGASKKGILVKGANYLEALANTETVVLDKTGTLTEGVFEVTDYLPAEGTGKEELLENAAYAERASGHPIAQSIRKAYGKSIPSSSSEELREIAGKGIKAQRGDGFVLCGNKALLDENGVSFGEPHANGTVVYIALDQKYLGAIVISDRIKKNAKESLSALKNNGVKKTVMLTGDHEVTAEYVAKETGVDEYKAELLPEDKVREVERLLETKSASGKLVFIGDGINDAPVLSRADIGIAMGALGSDAAIEAADVVLMDDDLSKLPLAIRISRKCLRIVKENIVFAIGVKILCLVFAAFGIANMWWAVFADVGVLIIAVLNATRTLHIS